jgi:hypothetical protein
MVKCAARPSTPRWRLKSQHSHVAPPGLRAQLPLAGGEVRAQLPKSPRNVRAPHRFGAARPRRNLQLACASTTVRGQSQGRFSRIRTVVPPAVRPFSVCRRGSLVAMYLRRNRRKAFLMHALQRACDRPRWFGARIRPRRNIGKPCAAKLCSASVSLPTVNAGIRWPRL